MALLERLLDDYPYSAIPKQDRHKADNVLRILSQLLFVSDLELSDLESEKKYREQRKQSRALARLALKHTNKGVLMC